MSGDSEYGARDLHEARRWTAAPGEMPPASREDPECEEDDEPVEFEPDAALLAKIRRGQH